MQPRPFELEQLFEEFEHVEGMHVLGSTDACTLSIRQLKRLAKATFEVQSTKLSYTDPKGSEELRTLVAALYQRRSPDEILITSKDAPS
jgi:hypothetical protein